MAEPRLELKIGAQVEATDGLFGRVHQVIISPLQSRVVGLVIRARLLPPRDWVLPIELIADASDDLVKLRVSREDILKQPVFDPSQFLPVAAEAQGYKQGEALASIHGGAGGSDELARTISYQSDETPVARRGTLEGHVVALQSGQQVWATDRRAGRVDLLLLDINGKVRHFVIRKGSFLSRDVIVPVDWIRTIDKRGVWLAMERAALDHLPAYRSDNALSDDVDHALWMDDVLRVIDYEAIDVEVHDGVVTLRGYASTSANKKRAESAARQVPGVLDVENWIVTDEEVATAVAQAIGRDERTRGKRIFISAGHGVVTLNGEIDMIEVRDAAEEIAGSIPLVRGVVNYIRTPGVIVEPKHQRVLQPHIGQNVYAEDMSLGFVERVIVSPRHRRVTAFVVRGSLPDLERARPGMLPYEIPRKERQIVLPIDAVQIVSISGVLLTVRAADAARYPDFDPDEFIMPDPGWQPPYPYQSSDILLDPAGLHVQELSRVMP